VSVPWPHEVSCVPNAEARMTFTEHLAELRTRIIYSGVWLVLACIVCYAFSNQLFNVIRAPLGPAATATSIEADGQSSPQKAPENEKKIEWFAGNILEPIMVRLKLAGMFGLLFSSPIIIYHACAFVFPGLTPGEKRVVRFLVLGCSALAITGVAVAYFGIFRYVLPYLIQWTPEGVVNRLRMDENVMLIIKALAAFALAFQFPMVVMVLVYMDLLSPSTLKKYRRIAIIGLAVVSSVLTPPDPISMIVMLVPLLALYEGSIWASYLVARRKKKAAA